MATSCEGLVYVKIQSHTSRRIERVDLGTTVVRDFSTFDLERWSEFSTFLRERVSQEREAMNPSIRRERTVDLLNATAEKDTKFFSVEHGCPFLRYVILTCQCFK
jgi:hypothetical protein